MAEPHETDPVEPEDDGEPRPSPSRRFRHLSRSKVAGAVAAALLALGLAWASGWMIVRSVIGWVEAQPEHQISFSEIKLEPEPPAYIRTGAVGILEGVRVGSRRPEQLSVPSINLAELKNDFLTRCPWVEEVVRIRRHYRRLEVQLAYRKPVALAEFDGGWLLVVDKAGVILPSDDIDWVEKVSPRYRPRGFDDPLVMILDVDQPATRAAGLPWKRAGDPDPLAGADLRVRGAARLAEFLQGRGRFTPKGRPAPSFVSISPERESLRYFLKDDRGHSVFWDQAPGSEPLGEATAEDKWAMLLDWVDRHGPLDVKGPDYLWLGRDGPTIVKGHPARLKKGKKAP